MRRSNKPTRSLLRFRTLRQNGAVAAALALALSAPALTPAALAGPTEPAKPASVEPQSTPARIEVAFVLDTTGSMSGLIEGAKRKIWSIANNIMDLKPKPEIRFALIGYRDRGDAYITKTFDLTEDVQAIYGELLAFRADGGGDSPESVNQALHEAVGKLGWSPDKAVFRTVFLVGDAPPHMDYKDDVHYPETLKAAAAKDIIVNAVQAGTQGDTQKIWREIAKLGGGAYVQIEQSGGMVSYPSPYDAEIEKLNIEINDTVVPYGVETKRAEIMDKVGRSKAMLGVVSAEMNAYFEKKSGPGGTRQVISGGGDLVEDVANGAVDLSKLEKKALPEDMQGLSAGDRKAYVASRAAQRSALRSELDHLLKKRASFVAEKQAAAMSKPDAFDTEVDRMIKAQAAAKGFK